jgi:hypothetical protein
MILLPPSSGCHHCDDGSSQYLPEHRRLFSLHHQGVITMLMEAISPFETLVNIKQTTSCNVVEGGHLRTLYYENFK